MEKFRRGGKGKGRREQGVARREVGLGGKFFKLLRSKVNKVKIGIVFNGTAVIDLCPSLNSAINHLMSQH